MRLQLLTSNKSNCDRTELTAAALNDPTFKTFPQQFDALHWHYYMPGLPQGAELLAYSAGCPNQMFRYGEHVYALQFHMEMTPDNVSSLVEHCAHDLNPGPHTMSKEQLLAGDILAINGRMHALLERLTAAYLEVLLLA